MRKQSLLCIASFVSSNGVSYFSFWPEPEYFISPSEGGGCMTDQQWTVQTATDYLRDQEGLDIDTADLKREIPRIALRARKNKPITRKEFAVARQNLISKQVTESFEKTEEGPLPGIVEEEGTPSAPGTVLSKFEESETAGLTKAVLLGWLEGASDRELRLVGHKCFGLDQASPPWYLKKAMKTKIEDWADDPTGLDPSQVPDFTDEEWESITQEVEKRKTEARERKESKGKSNKTPKHKTAQTIEEPSGTVDTGSDLPLKLDPPTPIETGEVTLENIDLEEGGDFVEGDTQPTLITQTEEVMEDLEVLPDEGEIEDQVFVETEVEEPQPEDGQPETVPAEVVEIAEAEELKMSEGSKAFMIISLVVAGIFLAVCLGIISAIIFITLIT